MNSESFYEACKSPNTTFDYFLGGRLLLEQPKNGYRIGVDPILLAASCPARSGDRILDMGCGSGAIALCLGRRIKGLNLYGIERNPEYAWLALKNGWANDIFFEVHHGDIAALPQELRKISFDHILSNPPYFMAKQSQPIEDPGRDAAFREDSPLEDWVRIAAKRLRPRGWLHIIQRVERTPELIAAAIGAKLGSLQVIGLSSRQGRPPKRIIFRAQKDGRAPFRLHPPLILHQGQSHEKDAPDYTPEISEALQNGAALKLPLKG